MFLCFRVFRTTTNRSRVQLSRKKFPPKVELFNHVGKIKQESFKIQDELVVKSSALDEAISFEWTYHGESVDLVPKQ